MFALGHRHYPVDQDVLYPLSVLVWFLLAGPIADLLPIKDDQIGLVASL